MKIAILGAPHTGKSTLIASLTPALATVGLGSHELSIAQALITAVQRDLRLGDTSGYAEAIAQHRQFDFSLLMGLDLPYAPHPSSIDKQVFRQQVDARLRELMQDQGLSFTVVYGSGPQRSAHALRAIRHHSGRPLPPQAARESAWQWACDKCSDAGCEHRMFTAGLKIGSRTGPP